MQDALFASTREKLVTLTQDPLGRAAALEREVDTLRRALVEARATRLAQGEAASQKTAVDNEAAVLRVQSEASGNPERQGLSPQVDRLKRDLTLTEHLESMGS